MDPAPSAAYHRVGFDGFAGLRQEINIQFRRVINTGIKLCGDGFGEIIILSCAAAVMAVSSDSARISTSLLVDRRVINTRQKCYQIMLTPTAICPELPEMPAADESATVVTLVLVRDRKVTSVPEILASSSTASVA